MNTRQSAQIKLTTIRKNLDTAFTIHYSCESFIDKPDGYSPRVSSIAIMHIDTGQTQSYSIHKYAEMRHVPKPAIEPHYDALERLMLDDFYAFLKAHPAHYFVHWNMRDSNYGFEALKHRYRVLGGQPVDLDETRLIDLARILYDWYGGGYIGHPRLLRLLEFNNISRKDMLTGEEEARAFAQKEYIKLHKSTLRKVDCIASLLNRQLAGRLKTQVSRREQWITALNDHWVIKALGILAILLTIVGASVLGVAGWLEAVVAQLFK